MAFRRSRLVKWVRKTRLVWWECVPDLRLEWFVSETQHYPRAYMFTYKPWLKGEGIFSVFSWGWLISWIMFSEYKVGSKSFTYKPRRFLFGTCRKPKLSMRHSQLCAINEFLSPLKSLFLMNVVKIKPLKLKGHCGMPSAATAFTIILWFYFLLLTQIDKKSGWRMIVEIWTWLRWSLCLLSALYSWLYSVCLILCKC